ncbi:MAG TPA: NAD+ synthase [Candidatus Krumholzibacteria bacterium]|nr:NAD+ synthase [Candidatus Krumholzibacteria bacterium]
MRIALVQTNPVVGDIEGNLGRVLRGLDRARAGHADLAVFHELVLSGYPPQDLLERRDFVAQCETALARLCESSQRLAGMGIVVGVPLPARAAAGKTVANAAVLIEGGRVLHRHDKLLLPTYDVFDEARHFAPGETAQPVPFGGEMLGISVCEDAWNDPDLCRPALYRIDPISMLADAGASIMINISASPFSVGKEAFRAELVRSHARRHGVPFVMVNQVGGNDELVFDGCSVFVDAHGNLRATLPAFEESMEIVDTKAVVAASVRTPVPELESIHRALVLGLRDYFAKCGFTRAVVGLSGGIDSALVVCLAAEGLGAENVLAVAMPSPFSSPHSLEDARSLARNLGLRFDVVPIDAAMGAYDGTLAGLFAGRPRDVAEENIQARIRGNILMAVSNKFGHMVLSTGNKSELAVGYCTLYGDMSGGLALISDVPKTVVYALARRINAGQPIIPERILTRAPSAELRPDQKDTDTLPPYEVLDPILDAYIEDLASIDEIVERGFDRAVVEWVVAAVHKNEYKRKQAAPGIKVTSKAFGVGRRFPVAARIRV